MEINGLTAFIASAELGSFSAAAQQLYLSQSAISKRIAALEQSVGVALFDRIGHQIRLTEAGMALLPQARIIVSQIADSKRIISNLQQQVSGKLSFGTSHHIALHRLPVVLQRFIQTYPLVELDIHFLDSEQIRKQVEQGKLELGIITLPQSEPKLLHMESVWRDTMQFYVAATHTLLQQKKVSYGDLTNYCAIVPPTGTVTRDIVESNLRSGKGSCGRVVETHSLETIKMLIAAGMGWGLLPVTMADTTVKALPLAMRLQQRQLGIVYHRHYTLSNAASALMKALRQEETELLVRQQ